MAVKVGVGHSKYTERKQQDLERVADVYMRIASLAFMPRGYVQQVYPILDLNAGWGIDPDGNPGSPIILMEAAERHHLPWLFRGFEKNDATLELLAEAIQSRCLDGSRIQLFSDHHVWTPYVIDDLRTRFGTNWMFGLAYGDGNGDYDAPFGPMGLLAESLPRVDLLLNFGATALKRMRRAGMTTDDLVSRITAIKKKHILIREPIGAQQWTMFLMTNWTEGPAKFGGALEFYPLTSLDGSAILDRVNLSAKERE